MGRYTTAIKTHAGIHWVSDYRWVPAKILIGQYATANYGMGWYSDSNQRRLEQVIGDRIPELIDQFRHEYDGSNTFGYVLSRRAAYCLPPSQCSTGKDELTRFRHPAFASTYGAMLGKGRYTLFNLQELQQSRILLELQADSIVSGVYILWNAEEPASVYVGISDDVRDRIRGHTNTGLYVWDVFATPDNKIASLVEKKVHKYLAQVGEPYLVSGKGRFRVKGQDARAVVKDFIHHYYGELFYNYGGTIE